MGKLTPDSILKFKSLSPPILSRDGKRAAFLVKDSNDEKEGYDTNIWLANLESKKTRQLTTSNKDGPFDWLNDEHIIFISDRGIKDPTKKDHTAFYRLGIQAGEAKREFSVPHPVEDFKWCNGKLIYKALVSTRPEDSTQEGYHSLDEIPFWANGKGFTNKKRYHLFLYNPDSDEIKDLTPRYVTVGEYAISKNKVVYVANEYEDKLSITNDLFIVSLQQDNPEAEILIDSDKQFTLVEFLDHTTLIVSSTDKENILISDNNQLFTIDVLDRELTKITPNWGKSMENCVRSDVRLGQGQSSTTADGKLYFVSTRGYSSNLISFDDSGNSEKLSPDNGSVDSFDVKNGRIVYVKLTEREPQELYTLSAKGQEKKITSINENAYPESSYSPLEHITVNRNGEIHTWIVKPPDFDAKRAYPAILEVHSGCKTVYGEVYFHELQLLANQGYIVICSNTSGTYEKKEDYLDLMQVVDTVTDKYSFIDKDRIGVTGGSSGGLMTNWIIGHTDRFKAAVSCRGISNWITSFGTTDIGYFYVAGQQDGNPWQDHKKLWERSPLKYADKVSTPTLFIHSREDYRCRMSESIQMFTALKYFDVTAKLCIFKGENHDLSRSGKPKNRINRLEEILSWFDKYL